MPRLCISKSENNFFCFEMVQNFIEKYLNHLVYKDELTYFKALYGISVQWKWINTEALWSIYIEMNLNSKMNTTWGDKVYIVLMNFIPKNLNCLYERGYLHIMIKYGESSWFLFRRNQGYVELQEWIFQRRCLSDQIKYTIFSRNKDNSSQCNSLLRNRISCLAYGK